MKHSRVKKILLKEQRQESRTGSSDLSLIKFQSITEWYGLLNSYNAMNFHWNLTWRTYIHTSRHRRATLLHGKTKITFSYRSIVLSIMRLSEHNFRENVQTNEISISDRTTYYATTIKIGFTQIAAEQCAVTR